MTENHPPVGFDATPQVRGLRVLQGGALYSSQNTFFVLETGNSFQTPQPPQKREEAIECCSASGEGCKTFRTPFRFFQTPSHPLT